MSDLAIVKDGLQEFERLIINQLKSGAECCGVSLPQYYIIREIGKHGTISIIDLSRQLKLDSSTLSRTVDNLVKSNIVSRKQDESDRRFVILCLTDEGKICFRDLEERYIANLEKIFSYIPQENRDTVLEGLGLFLKAFIKCCCTDCGC